MAKKSQHSNSATNSKKKMKKKSKPQPGVIAMKVKAPKLNNPFETIWSRRKFDILGKKRKGEERRIGLARSRAIDKVIKSLLVSASYTICLLLSFASLTSEFGDAEEEDAAEGV